MMMHSDFFVCAKVTTEKKSTANLREGGLELRQDKKGDQIGRIFAYILGDSLLRAVSGKLHKIFLTTLTKVMYSFLPKMGWATFWANIFTNPSGRPEGSFQRLSCPVRQASNALKNL
jgi:hypothetical protein